jgi:serine/threonine-protein kinase
MEAAESILRAGYRLDRYELLCPIASGGMATVWLARLRGKRGFEKLYAIKTIRTELVDDATFQEMFLDEARLASRIQHPNVAQILDLGEQQNVLFIVMEWVDGDSLAKIKKVLTKRKAVLPVGVTLRVLADACAGLHSAHELRDEESGEPLDLVHRDVSPQNILLSTVGAAKVIDFGIAKAHGRKQGTTRTGVVKGKIQYLAPEQVKKGATVDRRTDIWALGVCLQELVTGKMPYDKEDDVEVIRKLMTDEMPDPVQGVPEPIQKVLDRCLGFDPDVRFPTAAGLQRALEAAMKELGESTTTEDVASFLRTECPELANNRKSIVGKAIDEARLRPVADSSSKEEVAFAPTLVGETNALSQRAPPTQREGAIALTKRRGDSGQFVAHPATNASLELDQEPIVIPKRSLWWLWVLLLLGAVVGVGAYRFPDLTHRVLAMVGIGGGSTQSSDQAGAATATAAGTETATATPSASATATASTTASAASASASVSAPASAAPSGMPAASAPSGHHLTWPSHAPSASAEPAPEPANSNWSLYKNQAPPPPPPAPPPPPPPAPKPSATDSNPY